MRGTRPESGYRHVPKTAATRNGMMPDYGPF